MPGLGMRFAWKAGFRIVANRNDPNRFPKKQRPTSCLCFTDFCRTPVEFRAGYEMPGTETWVEAVFKLPRKGAHVAGCPYDVVTTLTAMAAWAENIENAEGIRLLGKLAKARFIVRLKGLGDAFGIAPAPVPTKAPGKGAVRHGRLNSGRYLAPYVVLASGLVKLYTNLRDQIDMNDWNAVVRLVRAVIEKGPAAVSELPPPQPPSLAARAAFPAAA